MNNKNMKRAHLALLPTIKKTPGNGQLKYVTINTMNIQNANMNKNEKSLLYEI